MSRPPPADRIWQVECDTCGQHGYVDRVIEECPHCGSTVIPQLIATPAAIQPAGTGLTVQRATPEQPRAELPPSTISRRAAAPVTHDAQLEGVVRDRLEGVPELPDPNWPLILFNILLIVDLAILGATYLIIFLVILILLVAVGLATGAGMFLIWLFAQPLFLLLRSMFGAVGRTTGRGNNLVPVVSFRVAPTMSHGLREFRLKGALTDTVIVPGDRVRVWGPVRNGVVHFRHGVRLDPAARATQPLVLRSNRLGWVLLALLGAVNLIILFTSFT